MRTEEISEQSYASLVGMYQSLKGIGSQLDALSTTIRELQLALALLVGVLSVWDVESKGTRSD